jgi:hypothetical protein
VSRKDAAADRWRAREARELVGLKARKGKPKPPRAKTKRPTGMLGAIDAAAIERKAGTLLWDDVTITIGDVVMPVESIAYPSIGDMVAERMARRAADAARRAEAARRGAISIRCPDGTELEVRRLAVDLFRFEISEDPWRGMLRTRAVSRVTDSTNGQPTEVEHTRFDRPESVTDWPALVRQALIDHLTHEVDECLRFADGRPVTEPHPEQQLFTMTLKWEP